MQRIKLKRERTMPAYRSPWYRWDPRIGAKGFCKSGLRKWEIPENTHKIRIVVCREPVEGAQKSMGYKAMNTCVADWARTQDLFYGEQGVYWWPEIEVVE